jgi:tripartite-type tricarboxylate transporter receptor subunit TctC
MLTRRQALATLTAVASQANVIAGAQAQAWPSKPIRWLVPVAPGGATDIVARLLQGPVGKRLGGSIIVENRTGGAGIIATQAAVTSAPDGYTMALIYTSHSVNAAMHAKMPYDSLKDISPVAFLWRAQLAVVVPAASPIKSLTELIAYAKAHPGELTYGSGGVGTGAHLAGVLLTDAADIKLTHAPYRGAAPALNDLLGNQIPVLIVNVLALPVHIEAGRVRALAVTGAKRSPVLPDVPTVAELGYPAYEATEWSGIVGPAHLPSEVVSRMNGAINAEIQGPEMAEKYRQLGLETNTMSPKEFEAFLVSETKRFSELLRKSGFKAE